MRAAPPNASTNRRRAHAWSAIAWSAAVLAAWLNPACRRASATLATSRPAATDAAPAGPYTLHVHATASLRAAFAAIARAYEAAHAGAKVELRTAGGPQIVQGLDRGAIGDVVALADSSLMSRLAAGALLAPGTARDFARNRLALAVARGNPRNVRTLADLARPEVRVALGIASDSIGRHTRWVLSRDKLQVAPKFQEPCIDDVVARVRNREADAAVVYATTLAADDPDLSLVAIPEEQNTPALYSIATLRMAKEPAAALAFRDFVCGERGQAILRDAGFRPR